MLRTKKILSALMLTFCSASLSLLLVNCNGSGFELADTCFNDGGDPLFSYAWHLANCGQAGVSRTGGTSGMDLNLRATWSAGILGNGVKVRVSDDGLENTHEDLKGNFQTVALRSRDYSLSATPTPNSSVWTSATAQPFNCPNANPNLSAYDDHGTAVAGLIAAVGGNGVGSRGVAPKAQLSIANLLSCKIAQTDDMLIDQATGTDFDILNMSWGVDQNKKPVVNTTYESQLRYAVTNYRSGKGAILVKAAGNFLATECNDTAFDGISDNETVCIGNSNFDGDNTNPYQIMVGALNAKGIASSYSSPGANLWISGFGGEFGYSSPAMVTTDRTGCANGFSYTGASNLLSFENGASPNANCNYTATFNGTSSAAPTISGVAALLLEANPNLTWRDVKYILAKTADPVDYVTTGSIPHPRAKYVSIPTGYSWELPWRTNGAGFKFQNWYGFGKVNVDAAVALAKSYASTLGTYHESAWANFTGLNLVVPANSAAGETSTVTISAADQNVKIESVQIRLEVTTTDISDLAIELTSPSGMRSIVVNMHNSLKELDNYTNEVFLTNAFYQERSTGLWTLKVISGGSSATITSWGIRFTGVK
ncbi:S8 family serine peptidase [Bdellovibrio sp. HCB274]|uniref:S8 family serine peptidase n=1 Tax=Bdellovibrio sp. HCB274 TaxID=3394361 RepID=UPI0039B4DC20